MRISQIMTREVVYCTPSDTVRATASLMKNHGVGAIPVVSDLLDPLLEGIVTDRDLCCGVLPDAKHADAVKVSEMMTAVPVTCELESTLEDCEELMRENQVRRLPVVDKRGRCVGIVSQADLAHCGSAAQVGRMLKEISKPSKPQLNIQLDKAYFYCGQLHEQDEILLLNRRRELGKEVEVVR